MTKRRIELISNSEVSHQTKGFSPPARIATLKVTPSVRSLQEWNFLDFPDLDFAIPLILGQPKLNGLTNVANIETYSIPENVKYIGKKTLTSTILNISKLPFFKKNQSMPPDITEILTTFWRLEIILFDYSDEHERTSTID
jgi:hypothetical protein